MIPSNGRAAMSLAEVRIGSGARADMHCHSTASEAAKLGIQRSVGLPECATPPEEVYELAKRRGMDFVTITDHDTIDGCLEIADRGDAFVSEELTTWFAGEPQAVHPPPAASDAASGSPAQSPRNRISCSLTTRRPASIRLSRPPSTTRSSSCAISNA